MVRVFIPWRDRAASDSRLAAATVLVAAVIGFGVFAPQDPWPRIAQGQDRWEHVGAFALLSFLALTQPGDRRWRVVGLLGTTVLIECVQHVLLETRTGSVADALFGAAGVALGYAGAVALGRAKTI